MDVHILSAWSDNYMYLVVDKASKDCAAVDPIEPKKIMEICDKNGLKLACILTTHHHADHASGNGDLAQIWKSKHGTELVVYGGDERVTALTKSVAHGQKFRIGRHLNVECLSTPCHTSGHICYYVTEDGQEDAGAVFTGDTLFLGGCGRFFEGTADQMYKALVGCLAKLPKATKVYCGHEYTVKNLEFAMTVEPENAALKKRLDEMKQRRASGLPTVPGTIAEEMETNPFMRVGEPMVLSHAKTNDPIVAMQRVRKEKDNF